jgi:hypothetical protein
MNLDFLSIKRSVDNITGQVSNLRTEIEGKKRRREEIAAAPLAREDVVQMVDTLFQCARDDFPAKLAKSLEQRIVACATALQVDRTALRQDASCNLMALHMEHPGGSHPPSAVDLEFSLFALLGQSLRDPLVKTIGEMPWPGKPGLPMAKRTGELTRLDTEIAELEAQLQKIEREAAAAGIKV